MLDLARLDLVENDPGVPARQALAIHYKGEPVFLATYDLAITTIFFEPQLAVDADFDAEWKQVLDALWQQYLDANPLKTHEDFKKRHGYS